jgi:hypothetical protein
VAACLAQPAWAATPAAQVGQCVAAWAATAAAGAADPTAAAAGAAAAGGLQAAGRAISHTEHAESRAHLLHTTQQIGRPCAPIYRGAAAALVEHASAPPYPAFLPGRHCVENAESVNSSITLYETLRQTPRRCCGPQHETSRGLPRTSEAGSRSRGHICALSHPHQSQIEHMGA